MKSSWVTHARNMIVLLSIAYCAVAHAQPVASELSGVVRCEEELVFVGDDANGWVFRLPLEQLHYNRGAAAFAVALTNEEFTASRFGTTSLVDLESIDRLGDGRLVVLSERLRGLVGHSGPIVEYPQPLSEIGNRGLEGLAARKITNDGTQVAVSWEGGYLVSHDLPSRLRQALHGFAMSPVVVEHTIRAGEVIGEVK